MKVDLTGSEAKRRIQKTTIRIAVDCDLELPLTATLSYGGLGCWDGNYQGFLVPITGILGHWSGQDGNHEKGKTRRVYGWSLQRSISPGYWPSLQNHANISYIHLTRRRYNMRIPSITTPLMTVIFASLKCAIFLTNGILYRYEPH